MKHSLILPLLLLAGLSFAAISCDDDDNKDKSEQVTTDGTVLPQRAQTILATYFPSEIRSITIDRDFGTVSEYDVVLKDGTEITFDRDGDWESIDTNSRTRAVPADLFPEGITTYVSINYPTELIVSIDRETTRYDVELSSGRDLIFDLDGNFQRLD